MYVSVCVDTRIKKKISTALGVNIILYGSNEYNGCINTNDTAQLGGSYLLRYSIQIITIVINKSKKLL